MAEQIPVGVILSLREAFDKVAHNAEKRADVRRHAGIIVQLLDELIGHREEEAHS